MGRSLRKGPKPNLVVTTRHVARAKAQAKDVVATMSDIERRLKGHRQEEMRLAKAIRMASPLPVNGDVRVDQRAVEIAYRILRRRTDLTLADLAVLVLCELADVGGFKTSLARAIRRDSRFVRVSHGRYTRS